MKKVPVVPKKVQKVKSENEHIRVAIEKSQARFIRVKNPKGADTGIGEYLLSVAITAKDTAVYLPVSIASGKKTTGFVYQIEGTAVGSIATAGVSARGEATTLVTLGTLLYCMIPPSTTSVFRIQVEIKGKIGKTYKVFINQINYKLHPSEARYKRFGEGVGSKSLEFK